MYINLHTKAKFCKKKKKIGIFCNNIITFSSRAHLVKKSTFLQKFHIFCTTLTFLHQNWYWQKHLSLCLKVCMTLFYHLLRNFICPKTDAFCIKCYFLLKQNNATKNWHFSKTENTPLRILNISIKN